MKPKIKILIAREGLIIISLLLFGGTSFFADTYINGQKEAYESNVRALELAATKAVPTKPQFYDVEGARKEGYSDTDGPLQIPLAKPPNTVYPFY
jgi:hypothetical protein